MEKIYLFISVPASVDPYSRENGDNLKREAFGVKEGMHIPGRVKALSRGEC